MPISAEAWFIYAARPDERGRPAELVRERYELEDLEPDEVLVEPLYGSWEANMQNAIERKPMDVCATRGDARGIIGNAGTARILAFGDEVKGLHEGQQVVPFGREVDPWDYPVRVMGFDSRMSGLLTTRLKLRKEGLIPIPESTRYSLPQWATFNNRYFTSWANWRVAYGTFRLLLDESEFETLNVWSWGGGTGLAETQLAAMLGHRAVALTSRSDRMQLIEQHGVTPVDRTPFANLHFDTERYRDDREFAESFRAAEQTFLETVKERTGGQGVQIFVEPIGTPVLRATLKALSRHGILTTMGWKAGMEIWYLRAIETIKRHQFIHTHFARRKEAEEAMAFGEQHGWMPTVDERVYTFDEIPELARDYAEGDYRMFPIYQVNPE